MGRETALARISASNNCGKGILIADVDEVKIKFLQTLFQKPKCKIFSTFSLKVNDGNHGISEQTRYQ